MKFTFREFFFILVLMALPVAAYYFVFEPRNVQIAAARDEIKKKQAKLDELNAATRGINDLGEQIDRLQKTIDLFEEKLPAEREVEVILREVWQLATGNKLNPKSIRTDKAITTAHYSELPMKMTILGNFDGFYNFLLELEKLPRITRMPKMTLKKLPEDEGAVEATVILSIFYESKAARKTGLSS